MKARRTKGGRGAPQGRIPPASVKRMEAHLAQAKAQAEALKHPTPGQPLHDLAARLELAQDQLVAALPTMLGDFERHQLEGLRAWDSIQAVKVALQVIFPCPAGGAP